MTQRPNAGRGSTVGGGFALLLIERGLQIFVAAVVGVAVARYLGPADLGIVNLATAFISLAAPLATGNQQLLVSELAKRPDDEDRILGAAGLTAIACTALAIAATVAVALLAPLGSSTERVAVIIAASALIPTPTFVLDAALQARHRFARLVLTRSVTVLVIAAARIALVVAGAPPLVFVAVTASQAALLAVGLYVAYRTGTASTLRVTVDRDYTRRLFRRSVPLLVTAVAIAVYMVIDQVMLSVISGTTDVGLYGAAVRLAEIAYAVPVAAVAVATPRLARLRSSDPSAFQQRVVQLTQALLLVAIVLGLACALLAKPIVTAVYGSAFSAASTPLAILAAGFPFLYMGLAQTPTTVNDGHETAYMARALCGAALNIAINLVAIPRFGAAGAAWATVAAYAFVGFVGNAFIAQTRPVFAMQVRALHPVGLLEGARESLRLFRPRDHGR